MTAKLAAALVAAQAEMPAVEADAMNPQWKTRFVSLDNLIAKTRPVLNRHGLALIQLPTTNELGAPVLRTILIHGESGEQVSADAPLIVGKNDMQGLGSAITYARRYAWAAALGISSDEDDDGNGASRSKGSGSEPSGRPVRAAAAGAQAPVAGKTADAPASGPDRTPDPTEPADLAIAAHCSRLEAELLMLSGQLDVDRHLVETMIAARQAEHDGDPEALRAWLERQVEQAHKSLEAQQEPSFEPPKGERGTPQLATKGMQTKVIIAAKEAGLDDDARHALLERVVGNPSTKQLLRKDVQKVLDAIEAVAVPF